MWIFLDFIHYKHIQCCVQINQFCERHFTNVGILIKFASLISSNRMIPKEGKCNFLMFLNSGKKCLLQDKYGSSPNIHNSVIQPVELLYSYFPTLLLIDRINSQNVVIVLRSCSYSLLIHYTYDWSSRRCILGGSAHIWIWCRLAELIRWKDEFNIPF